MKKTTRKAARKVKEAVDTGVAETKKAVRRAQLEIIIQSPIFTVISSMLWGSMIGILLHAILDGVWSVFLGGAVGMLTLALHMAVHARDYS